MSESLIISDLHFAKCNTGPSPQDNACNTKMTKKEQFEKGFKFTAFGKEELYYFRYNGKDSIDRYKAKGGDYIDSYKVKGVNVMSVGYYVQGINKKQYMQIAYADMIFI